MGSSERPRALTFRVILLGAILIAANDLWVAQMEPIGGAGRATIFALNFATLFGLLSVLLLNRLLQLLSPKLALSRGELVVLYVMATIGLALFGTDGLQVLIPFIVGPAGNATPENGWQALIVARLPDALVIKDPAAITAIFGGHARFADYLAVWARPLLCWSALTLLQVWVMLCMSVILRRQWTEHERLAYPLVAVPLEVLKPEVDPKSRQVFWLGFALAAAITAVNQVHAALPAVPEIRTAASSLNPSLRGWFKACSPTFLAFYPWAIGLGFLLPVDLLLSSWVFFWLWQLQRVGAVALGISVGSPQAPWIDQQTQGAWLAICLAAIWFGRQEWRRIGRTAFGDGPDDRDEPMPYRVAVWGLALGFAGLVVFGVMAGLGFWLAILFFALVLANTMTVMRVRAEFGAPVHDLINVDPGKLLIGTVGIGPFSVPQVLGLSVMQWFCRGYRSSPAPFMLEGYRLGDLSGVGRRTIAAAVVIATVIGIPAGLFAMLRPLHELGLDSGHVQGYARLFTTEQWNITASWLSRPPLHDERGLVAILFGALSVWALMAIRLRFVGFMLHPVAYAVTSSWTMGLLWLPLAIAWLCKASVLRAGGLKLYRDVRPFFLGVLLGDFVVTAVGQIIAVIGGWRGYPLFV